MNSSVLIDSNEHDISSKKVQRNDAEINEIDVEINEIDPMFKI